MIHETAHIAPDAQLGVNVTVGPFCVIDKDVVVGDNCRVGPHAYITGNTTIGDGTEIHASAVIGGTPQDKHYKGEESYTEIGSDCILREYVTIHRGTDPGTTTRVGNRVMMMATSHAGHNCCIGNDVVMANGSMLGGHVHVDDRAFISALVAVHQFVRIGELAMVGGINRIRQDIPPYCMVQLEQVQGLNSIGLRRAGFPASVRSALKKAFTIFFKQGRNRQNALQVIRDEVEPLPEVEKFIAFIDATERGITGGTTS